MTELSDIALDVLHHHTVLSVFLEKGVELYYLRMNEAGLDLCLLPEALHKLSIDRQRGIQHLQCHLAIEQRSSGKVTVPIPPSPSSRTI